MDLDGRIIRREPPQQDQEQVRRAAPQGERGLLMGPAHRDPGRVVADHPLAGAPGHVRGVHVQRLAGGQPGGPQVRLAAGRPGQHRQPFVDPVGRDVRGDGGPPAPGRLLPGRQRELGVHDVDRGLVGHPPRPEPGGLLLAERPDRRVTGLPERGDQPVRAGAEPSGVLGRVIRDPPAGDLTERDGLRGPGADDLRRPALGPADVGGQLPQRPVRAGGHGRGEVGAAGQPGQGPGAGRDDLIVAPGGEHARDQPQPQPPPQQPPPPAERGPAALARPPTDTADSSLTVSSWPSGHRDESDASLIGRVRSNVDPQARHRYS